jgi:hypothetical protein
MFFQACVDDSGSEPQSSFFVLGGFLADSSQWSNFISEWNEVLHKAPSIDYFKLNEAIALKKEFDKEKGWDEKKRDKKIDDLLDVILRHIRVRKHATIKHSEFDKYFLSIPKPKRHKAVENPYVFLAMQLIFAVAAHSPIHKIQTPCNFIFDDQERFSDALQNWYPIFRKQAFTSWGKTDFPLYLGQAPKFENDKTFVPLQAADLYAGLIRRHCNNNKVIIAPPSSPLRRLLTIPEIPRNYMAPELRRLNAHLQKEGAKFYAANPAARKLQKQVKKRKAKST